MNGRPTHVAPHFRGRAPSPAQCTTPSFFSDLLRELRLTITVIEVGGDRTAVGSHERLAEREISPALNREPEEGPCHGPRRGRVGFRRKLEDIGRPEHVLLGFNGSRRQHERGADDAGVKNTDPHDHTSVSLSGLGSVREETAWPITVGDETGTTPSQWQSAAIINGANLA
jgi:hypothetical protein